MRLLLTQPERAAVDKLAAELDISPAAVLRQALRHYQLVRARLAAGETLHFSGDAARAAEFAGPLYSPPVDPGQRVLDALREGTHGWLGPRAPRSPPSLREL